MGRRGRNLVRTRADVRPEFVKLWESGADGRQGVWVRGRPGGAPECVARPQIAD